MEIRFLYTTEVQLAANIASEVFENCVRSYLSGMEEDVRQFYQYVRPEYLWQEMNSGRLLLWGAFEDGRILAVCGMQNVGHITMLYVRPEAWHRGIGSRMVQTMIFYAQNMLHMNRVTINVVPAEATPFFYQQGFNVMQQARRDVNYVSMEQYVHGTSGTYAGAAAGYGRGTTAGGAAYAAQTKVKQPEVIYPVKKVSTKVILAMTAIVLALCIAIGSGVTFYYIATEGVSINETPADNGFDIFDELNDWQEL
jgi:GNAT superfamily N-acetyltransferase